jgi:hypothetical protein
MTDKDKAAALQGTDPAAPAPKEGDAVDCYLCVEPCVVGGVRYRAGNPFYVKSGAVAPPYFKKA